MVKHDLNSTFSCCIYIQWEQKLNVQHYYIQRLLLLSSYCIILYNYTMNENRVLTVRVACFFFFSFFLFFNFKMLLWLVQQILHAYSAVASKNKRKISKYWQKQCTFSLALLYQVCLSTDTLDEKWVFCIYFTLHVF